MSYTPIQTEPEEKPEINTSAGSTAPPVYIPAQSTEAPQQQQQPQQQPPQQYVPQQPQQQYVPQQPQHQYVPQQPQQQYVPQQQQPVVQYVMQPQPYMYPGAGGQMIVVPPRPPLLPKELQPNDYLIVTLIVIIVCGIFNITSFVFSIPALICSVMAFERRNSGFYTTAKNLGVAAIILDLICVTWVVVGGVITVGVLTACIYGDLCYYY